MDTKLKKVIDAINKSSGKDMAFSGNTVDKTEPLPTGIEAIDYITGIGGFPMGRITEIYGMQGSAKTSICLAAIANAQRLGKSCVFVDAEHTFSPDHAMGHGVDVDNMIVIQPDCGEEALEAIEKLITENVVDMIVVDSVPSLLPRAEAEAEIGKPTMGGQARLLSSALRRLVPLVAKNKTVLVLINQLRVNIMGGQWEPYTTPGGMAMRFYTSLRLEVKKVGNVKKGEDIVGLRSRVKVIKNKLSHSNDDCEIDLIFGQGFISNLDLVDVGTKKGVLTRSGNTYFWGETKLGVGKEKSLAFLEENEELKESLRLALLQ